MPDLDVTKNFRNIEKLKSELLSGVADLYESMLMPAWQDEERVVIFADVIIKAYALAKRTGIDYSYLDDTIVKRLRLETIEDEKGTSDSRRLLRYLERGGSRK